MSDSTYDRLQPGSRGVSGFSGYSGVGGGSGFSGYSGVSGGSGFSGYSGASGSVGGDGTSGFSGYSGVSGASSATPPTAGTVVSLSASCDPVTANTTSVMRAITIPDNTYSFIRARATGYFIGAGDALELTVANVTISGIGASISPSVRFWSAAIGLDEWMEGCFLIEYHDRQLASRAINLVLTQDKIVQNYGGTTCVMTSFIVEGIV